MPPPAPFPALCAAVVLASSVAALHCSSPAAGSGDGGSCYPDSDGVSGGHYTFDLTVDDTGFSKNLLDTQNDARVTLTLTNAGTRPHGFHVGCADPSAVAFAYPDLPASCPQTVCFPSDASIAPIMPGASATIVFSTPAVDLLYPFGSNEPGDSAVPGLNGQQWNVM